MTRRESPAFCRVADPIDECARVCETLPSSETAPNRQSRARNTSGALVSTYAIGDIQGCFASLERLLERIRFGRRDRVWLVGDLVNRGPASLEVLRWARRLGDRCVAVLGNHDLHLLARAAGVSPARPRDTLEPVLEARDRGALLDWLAARPLLHRAGNHLLVHAGLHPRWTLREAERAARAGEAALRGPESAAALREIAHGHGRGRLAAVAKGVGVLTRIRTCSVATGAPEPHFNHAPEEAPPGLRPWFAFARRPTARYTAVFGHWAALGLYLEEKVVALDSGCAWGRGLTAFRLEDRAVFQVPSVEFRVHD